MSFQELFPIDMLTGSQWQALFPLVAVTLGSLLGLLFCPIPRLGRALAFASVIGGLLLALLGLVLVTPEAPQSILEGVLTFDRMSHVFSFVILAMTLGSCLMSLGYDEREYIVPEIYPLMGLACVGMLGLVSSRHLMFVFISLELMSLAVYVMVSLQRHSAAAAEGGLKYFLLGGAASSILLYGVSLLYGTTGSLQFGPIAENFQNLWQGQAPFLFALGLALVAVGLLFKLGAVPFHSWVPDVYTGAVTPVTGFMISAVKLAAVGLALRLGIELFALPGLFADSGALAQVLQIVTFLTLALGSLIGLAQTDLKRLLAYSTIAHTGYLLLGFAALTVGKHADAADAIASYAVLYAIMNIGCFAVLTLLTQKSQDALTLDDLAGLGKRRPVLAFSLTVFLLSMAGIPPTAGFFGKYYLFMSAVAADQIALTVVAALASLISAAYYLRPVVKMYMDEGSSQSADAPEARWLGATLVTALSLLATLLFGLVPGLVAGLLAS